MVREGGALKLIQEIEDMERAKQTKPKLASETVSNQ